MTERLTREAELTAVLATLQLPAGVQVRKWIETDLPATQSISDQQGWPTHQTPEEMILAWNTSWPALVATKDEQVIGYVRAMTDTTVLMHIADLAVDANQRKQGVGHLLLEVCHLLFPNTLVTLTAEPAAIPFYTRIGFKPSGDTYVKVYRRS